MNRQSFEKWKEPQYDDAESSSESGGLISEPSRSRFRKVQLQKVSYRVVAEAALVVIIVLLLSAIVSHRHDSTPKLRRFGPSLPEKVVTFGNVAGFGPDQIYVDHEMLFNATHKRELHENWQALYPKSRGYVHTRPGDDFEIATPPYSLDDVFGEESGDHHDGYILSVFHQLHCLSILMSRLGTSYEEFGKYTRPQLEHTSHCVEYLRQAILCQADTSLEGETGSYTDSAAWGQKHVCKDYDALMEMADDRGIWDLSDKRQPNRGYYAKELEHAYGGIV